MLQDGAVQVASENKWGAETETAGGDWTEARGSLRGGNRQRLGEVGEGWRL